MNQVPGGPPPPPGEDHVDPGSVNQSNSGQYYQHAPPAQWNTGSFSSRCHTWRRPELPLPNHLLPNYYPPPPNSVLSARSWILNQLDIRFCRYLADCIHSYFMNQPENRHYPPSSYFPANSHLASSNPGFAGPPAAAVPYHHQPYVHTQASSTFSNRPDPNGDDHTFAGSSGTAPTGAQESEPRSSLPDTEESPSAVEEVQEMWQNSQVAQRETHSDSDNPADSGTPKFWHSTPNSQQSTGEKESNPIKLQPTPSATTTITPAEHDADDSDKDADADDLDDMFLAELDNDDHGEEAEEDQSTLNMSEDDCGDGHEETISMKDSVSESQDHDDTPSAEVHVGSDTPAPKRPHSLEKAVRPKRNAPLPVRYRD